jgi:hypothetical protein
VTNDAIESLKKSSARLVADAEEARKSLHSLLEIESPAVGTNQEEAIPETLPGKRFRKIASFKEVVRKFWKARDTLQVKR